jgi:hypothetical protein
MDDEDFDDKEAAAEKQATQNNPDEELRRLGVQVRR